MVNFKELGLVNTRDMFAKAIKGGYAIPAFNFNNMEQLQAIIKAASETKSPVILQVSKGARNYANATLLRYMAQGAVAYAKELGWANPQIVLHLDHGDSFELCKDCIDCGFSSVMIDGSHLPYEENVALTKKVVDYAHQYDVTVEGELGPDYMKANENDKNSMYFDTFEKDIKSLMRKQVIKSYTFIGIVIGLIFCVIENYPKDDKIVSKATPIIIIGVCIFMAISFNIDVDNDKMDLASYYHEYMTK